MYLIGKIPNEWIIFSYGAKITEQRKQRIYEELLKYVCDNYDIPKGHQTIERAIKTIDQKFSKYSSFEWNGRSFKADEMSVCNQKFKIINVE